MKQHLLIGALLCAAIFAGTACSDDDSSSDKTYRTGDFYSDGGVRGIVIKITDGGRHGLIVSLDENDVSSWASAEAVTMDTRATNTDDGSVNMMAVEAISGWQTKFPAFAWCGAKNTGGVSGWYLPAYYELGNLLDVYLADKAAFNKTLTDNGGTAIAPTADNYYYWSSSQNLLAAKVSEAAVLGFLDEGTRAFMEKDRTARVRAVRVF